MNDKRLDILKNAIAEPGAVYGPVRIDRIKISNYKYFHGDFELAIAGKNLLMYGENGSGKSSIYKALCYLTKLKFDTIAGEKNIFCGNEEPQIEFGFSNGRELIIDSDLTELPDSVDFLRGLSVFTPMLDYKKLLKIHYTPDMNGDSINIYTMLRELFRDYIDPSGKKLSEIRDFIRKEFERFLKTFLSPAEQRNKHGEELDLAALISRARSKTTGEARIILDRLDTNRKHLFNPQCHHDTRNIYTKEVKTAIDDLEKLLAILR